MSVLKRRTTQAAHNPQNHSYPSACFACSALIVACALTIACGKKGPPLPPLVKLPVAPADFTAERRGDDVELQFTVPGANTDNTKPANIQRVDVYGLTGPANVTDAELFKYGTRVGSVDVKAPRNPDDTTDPDDSESDVEAPVGKGLDQGARAHVDEPVEPDTLKPIAVAPSNKAPVGEDGDRPLLGPSIAPPSRTYVSVGVTTKGRRGPASKRIALPLVPPPAPPSAPTVNYTETAITVAWNAPEARSESTVLPSRPLAAVQPAIGFNVYELTPPAVSDAKSTRAEQARSARAQSEGTVETRLTKTPIKETEYTDSRITWGAERCYAIRATETIGSTTIESEPGPKACRKLVDTFPPAAPKGLTAVASQASISLIWDPNTEADLAGYIVLRGPSADALQPITPGPITDTTFKDDVQAGVKYVYAVEAVDKAGNVSTASNPVEETAR